MPGHVSREWHDGMASVSLCINSEARPSPEASHVKRAGKLPPVLFLLNTLLSTW